MEALADSLADAISASPARLQELYVEIGVELVYDAKERMVVVTIRPPVGLMRVSVGRVARYRHASKSPLERRRSAVGFVRA
ncbi:hypothetical protein [Amycolatopsis rubida]|uniref:Uncharacterized protein n=1 Tax=Amycolatopsis rubida TaxID=112413 RepID=A0A1I5SCX0_9PSEU|nr:hypothetical protein [Amycolatopsis rubida]SFP68581.1 hypothetical protein SAMN05421854_106281 [Amycolatopsis rubida]